MRRLTLAAASLLLAAGVAPAAASPGLPPASAPGPAPIIGGTRTTVGQFPTVVALTVAGNICTGTLIHRDWVLTAAHCITPSLLGLANQQAVTQSIRVHFGTVDLSQSNGIVRSASLTIPKPGFAPSALGSNDIGLVKLSQPVTDLEPTPVNLDATDAPIGTVVTMVGFGATERNGAGMVGVQYQLAGRASISCTQFDVSDTNLLCFSQTDNRGKCRGDSGGPSFAQVRGRTVVVGVTSFGDGECAQLAADTRTDVERQFLRMHIPTLSGCDGDEDCPGEVCFDGRCIAAPFSPGGLGSSCVTGADCDSGACGEGPGGKKCTDLCSAGDELDCPDGFECLSSPNADGACWPEDTGGCCDTGRRDGAAPAALFATALGALLLRRRRRRP